MLLKLKCASLLGFTSSVLGHGYVSGIVANGKYTEGWQISFWLDEEALDLGFIPPDKYQSENIVCHKNAVNANVSTTAAARSAVEFQWTTLPHSIGPVLTYVTNCGRNCSLVDQNTLKFVKIDESGIDFTTQVRASEVLIENNSSWTTTVPASLAPGHYVFRHEIIACHGAGSLDGTENYPFCVNIDVTGSDTENPTGTLATELYTETDSGIYFNPYQTLASYAIPGPMLWTG